MTLRLPKEFASDKIYFHPLAKFPYRRRLQVALKLSGDLKGKSVLDVGFGMGSFIYLLIKQGQAKKIVGAGYSDKQMKITKKTFKNLGVDKKCTLKIADIRDTKLPANSFDAVYSLDVLEHIEDIDKALLEIKRILKPGGIFISSTPEETLIYRIARKIAGYKKPHDHYHTAGGMQEHIGRHFSVEKRKKVFWFFPLFRLVKARKVE